MTRIALYQPDIPQNLGSMMRLCACMGAGLDIIEPCGFLWDERKIKQSAMDYFDKITIARHTSWDRFFDHYQGKSRIILMTTKTDMPYTAFKFQPEDILLAGRESAGVPENVHESAFARIGIPMKTGFRSLNIVNATAMVLGEALRQTDWVKT
jgi:tRNA (cytidine/uridine-2'-O-)-methyltransferase